MAVTAEALRTAIKKVISAEKMKDLTNQDDEGRTVIDDDLLLEVCQDAIGEYCIMTGQDYGQDSDREFIEMTLLKTYVMYKLYEYAQNLDYMEVYERLLDTRNQNLMRWGGTFTDTNKVHASEHRPQDYRGYRTGRSQSDVNDMSRSSRIYEDPDSPYS